MKPTSSSSPPSINARGYRTRHVRALSRQSDLSTCPETTTKPHISPPSLLRGAVLAYARPRFPCRIKRFQGGLYSRPRRQSIASVRVSRGQRSGERLAGQQRLLQRTPFATHARHDDDVPDSKTDTGTYRCGGKASEAATHVECDCKRVCPGSSCSCAAAARRGAAALRT